MDTTPYSIRITTRIAHNSETHVYDCFLTVGNGEQAIGSCGAYHDAETYCDATVHTLVFDLLRAGMGTPVDDAGALTHATHA